MTKNSAQPEVAIKTHSIATAAQSVGVSVQTVRLYELRGLITPARTSGGTRRYHAEDLARLRQISELIERGVNLAGIGIILELEAENLELEAENDGLREKLAARPQRESKD